MTLLSSRLRSTAGVFVVASTAAVSLASPALAWHRHHVHRAVQAYATPAYAGYAYPAYEGGWQAAVIAQRAAENQNAPGVTNELAPDNIATATGGPSGGVPGFSGH